MSLTLPSKGFQSPWYWHPIRRGGWLTICAWFAILINLTVFQTSAWSVPRVLLVPIQEAANGPRDPRVLIDSHWSLACHATPNVLVNWTCTPFVSEHDHKSHLEAEINLNVEQLNGFLHCQVVQPTDRTDHEKGHYVARVSAQVAGTGVAQFHVTISCVGDDSLVAAGQYSTTLLGTVTAP